MEKSPTQVVVEFANKEDEANPFAGNKDKEEFKMFVLPSDLIPVVDKSGTAGTAPADFTMADLDKSKFFTANEQDGNLIHKAAATTRGRGLAGFVTSLDFDYSESTYETATLTRRAPKMIKVSMAFSPIHDIAPGMDHNGGFRAPLYPVGDIMTQLSQDEIRNVEAYGIKKETTPDTVMGKEKLDDSALKTASPAYNDSAGSKAPGTDPGRHFRKALSGVVKDK